MKTLFFDIDGTILPLSDNGKYQTVPESTITALKALKEKGHIIVIATGKARFMMQGLLDDIGVNFDYLIGSNGNVVLEVNNDNETIIHDGAFTNQEIHDLIEWAKKNNFHLGWHGLYDGAAEEFADFTYMETALNHANLEVMKPNKNFVHDNKIYQGLVYAHEDELKDNLQHESLYFWQWHKNGADILKKGINKAFGIKQVINYHNQHYPEKLILQKDTYGFGDSGNDIEMFKYVNYPVVMGNATSEIKEMAKKVNKNTIITDKHIENGIYNACQKLGLI